MSSRFHKLTIRARLAVRQNRAALAFVGVWIGANLIVFAKTMHLPPLSALLLAVCVTKAHGGWPGVYQSFTEVVVFGVVASLVVTNVTRRYRPEETCRALAAEATGHVVVVGFTNLGKRIWEITRAAGRVAVVVEEDATLVAALIADEEPLVRGSARDRSSLVSANVARADVVVIAVDDLETAAIAARLVRELNAECELVVRAADENVADVLARTYRARAVSTSRLAAEWILAHARKLRVKRALLLGDSSLAERLAEALRGERVVVARAAAASREALTAADAANVDFVVLCEDDLGENLVAVDRIRQINKRARIVCRVFHEEAAALLTRAPYDCVLLSTSRHAAEMLARGGAFRDLGVAEVALARRASSQLATPS